MVDINQKVRELYNSNKYYFSYNRKENKSSYWSKKVDPNGIIRDRIKNHNSEKKKFLKNNKNLINIINTLKIKNFCDVGCGAGYLMSYFSSKLDTFGIENDVKAIKLANNYGKILNFDINKKINISKKFDLLVSYHVIEHLKNPENFLKDIKKNIKNKKYLIIGTPDFDCFMARFYKNKFRLLHDKTHISLFSKDSLCRMIRDNGFRIIKIEFPYLDTEYFNKKSFMSVLNKKRSSYSPAFYGNFITVLCQKI